MRILLLGAQGQLGRELAQSLGALGELIALDRQQLDLCQPDKLLVQIPPYRAEVIVNAAAYTAVDQAEREPEQAMAINATALATLALIARETHALLIHYSTDYVFAGDQTRPYRETDAPCPINCYGRSKLMGERAVQASGCDYLLLRTSWVYSAGGHNFVRRILTLARERDQLQVVNDQQGSPTSARHLALASTQLISLAQAARRQKTFISELYHLCGEGSTNWYEFACAVVVEAHTCGLVGREPVILPIASKDYPQPAQRPAYSVLNTTKVQQQLRIRLPHWREGVREVVQTISDLGI